MRRPSRRRRSGWDELGGDNPVPGDVLACLDELGVEIIRVKGDEAEARCPAHLERTGKEDRHPSFSVNVEEGYYNCFSCGFRGPFVTLVAWMLKMDRGEATTWIRARGGIERVRKILARKDGLLIDEHDTTKNINEASLALFTDPPQWAREERNISLEACHRFGVLWDPKKDTWIVPIREPGTGTLMGWQAKNKRYFRNHPYNMEKGLAVFGLNEVEGAESVLVESPLDVLRMWTAGEYEAVSTFGAGWTDTQIRLLIDRLEILIVALDNDRDGRKYGKMLKERYSKRLIMRFLNYADTDAKDPGEMTDSEIHNAVGTAISSVLVKF